MNLIDSDDFLKSLGFPTVDIHETFSHFDFTQPGRRILLIGPMGSGKTEFSARVWRDAAIAAKKSPVVKQMMSTGKVDRSNVFFIRSEVDSSRFTDYPDDALPYRSGYVRCGENIARIRDSFGLEKVIEDNPEVGTYIIDEASFFDERIAYVVQNYSVSRGIMFIFPTLILNFRKDLFNLTAKLILDMATDVVPLTAYCEHQDCISDAFYTYRYYTVGGKECPALYFDPLIIVGGDRQKQGSLEPNYAARCDRHHYLPGKEYTFFHLKPFGEELSRGNDMPLITELAAIKNNMKSSMLYRSVSENCRNDDEMEIMLNSLLPDNIAEKALMYLFVEQNLVTEPQLIKISEMLELDTDYMSGTLSANKRPISFDQNYLL